MDIFTTQLTRVVPVPIKPASLKVKKLVKDAGASKLKHDPDHIENHQYYFKKSEDETYHPDGHTDEQEQHAELEEELATELKTLSDDDGKAIDATDNEAQDSDLPDTKEDHKGKHLDLYA